MSWEFNNDRPIYLQLMDQIQLKIINDTYKPGEKLPSVRDMASQAAVNPNTMQKALTELEKTNLIFSRRTSGRYITEDITIIKSIRIDLAKKHIDNFIKNMESMGFTKDELIKLIDNLAKEI